MKTERLTLMVTPEEKALITGRAERLGVSASEFVRRAVEAFDADDLAAMEELSVLLPELNAMAERIEVRQAEWEARREAHERQVAYLKSDAYREQVREDILTDDTINWDAVEEIFGFARGSEAA